MKVTAWNRIMSAVVIVTVSLVGTSALTNAQGKWQQNQKGQIFAKDVVNTDTKIQQRQQDQNRQQQDQNKQAQNKQQQDQQRFQDQNKQQLQDQQRLQDQRQQQDQNKQAQQQQSERLSQQRQQQLIEQHRQSMTQYRQHVDQEVNLAPQRITHLQQQNRMAQYRYQQQYFERLRQQQLALQNDRNHDYDNDPYFYTAPSYRYQRGGNYYETNQYGANLLRQAVNYGYAEGFQAGQADRQDRWWRSSYRDSFAYQDANYGYNGYYVDQDAYNYYFRQGFRRGYEDGYRNRYRYGRYDNGAYSMLDVILVKIIVFQLLH